MTRFRLTIRGEGTELRGYGTIQAMAALTLPPGEQPYVVVASPAADDYDPFAISEPEFPPTPDMSADVIQALWDQSVSPEHFLGQMAHLHYMQAMVIRGERARAETAEAELAARELHHFETEQLLARIVAARSNHPDLPVCEKYPDPQDFVKCGWRMAVEDIDKVLADVPDA